MDLLSYPWLWVPCVYLWLPSQCCCFRVHKAQSTAKLPQNLIANPVCLGKKPALVVEREVGSFARQRSVGAHRAPNSLLRPRFIPFLSFLSFFSYLLIYIFVYEGPGLLSQSSTTEPHPQPKTLISETQFSDTFYLFALWYGFPWIVRKTHKLYSLLSSCSYCSKFLNACVAKRSRTDSLRLLWRRIPIL